MRLDTVINNGLAYTSAASSSSVTAGEHSLTSDKGCFLVVEVSLQLHCGTEGNTRGVPLELRLAETPHPSVTRQDGRALLPTRRASSEA